MLSRTHHDVRVHLPVPRATKEKLGAAQDQRQHGEPAWLASKRRCGRKKALPNLLLARGHLVASCRGAPGQRQSRRGFRVAFSANAASGEPSQRTFETPLHGVRSHRAPSAVAQWRRAARLRLLRAREVSLEWASPWRFESRSDLGMRQVMGIFGDPHRGFIVTVQDVKSDFECPTGLGCRLRLAPMALAALEGSYWTYWG